MCCAEIAVMLGTDGRTVAAGLPATVVVYRKDRARWKPDREFSFRLDENKGLPELRKIMGGLVSFLSGCRALVAESASGAVFFELAKARVAVFEIPGSPDTFLDSVWRDLREDEEIPPPRADLAIPAPVETAPGYFTISITEIQGRRPELSSKQVLRNFVRRGEFAELAIRCDHVPPWLEMESVQLGYDLLTERTGMNELSVVLRKSAGGCC